MPDTVKCPACGKVIAVKGIPKHTNGCHKWAEVIGTSPSEFNFDKYFKRKIYADEALEGIDYVECLLCPDRHRALRLADHLKQVHRLSVREYLERFPGASVTAQKSIDQRQKTVQAKYGVSNIAYDPGVREKISEAKKAETLETRKKRAKTNLFRYGHENPFGSEVIKRRIRETMQEKYGAGNPQQVPEIRERTLQTHEERYGAPYAFTTPGFQERFKETSQEHWGVDHPMKSIIGKGLCHAAVQEKYGYDSVFQSDAKQAVIYLTNLANHEGKHSQQCEDVLAKARATWMEKYGVDNPSKAEEVKNRIKDVWMGKYGVPFPPQSLWANQVCSFPNKFEQSVVALCPVGVVYSGDGAYWIRYPGASRARNPDFVVLSADQIVAYQNGTSLNDLRTYKIIEAFGDYWHGPEITGKSREAHKLEVVDFYTKAGVQCLIIWESEIKKHPKRVAERIHAYIFGLS